MSRKKDETSLHWSEHKEEVHSSIPIKLLLSLLKILPSGFTFAICFPVAFFYTLFVPHARKEAVAYQKKLKSFSQGKSPKIISAYRQILSFSICLVEKLSGWLGKVEYTDLILHDDDCQELIQRLEEGKGAVVFCSHLGNIELLRSLSSFHRTGVSRDVPVNVLMEVNTSAIFFNTLKEVNPGFSMNAIDTRNIGPDTIVHLQECLEHGELVVCAGDRTSAASKERFIRKPFLGEDADFPYGVYLMAMLLKEPVYFMFGLRSRTATLHPKNHMIVEKAKTETDCPRSEREERITMLCQEFIDRLEHYCIQFPYQWYNFYNFWMKQLPKSKGNE